MRALLYLMLLCCIKIYPSMPIFNVSSWSFSVAESCCRAWRPSPGSCDHTVAVEKAFCVVSPPPRSSFSIFLHNYLKVITEINEVLSLPWAVLKSTIYTCPAHLHKSLQTLNNALSKRGTNNTTCCPEHFLCLHNVIGSVRRGVFAAVYEALETNDMMHPSMKPTAFFMSFSIGDNVWEQTKSSFLRPSWQKQHSC